MKSGNGNIEVLDLEWDEIAKVLKQFAEYDPEAFLNPFKRPVKPASGEQGQPPDAFQQALGEFLHQTEKFNRAMSEDSDAGKPKGQPKGQHFFKVRYAPGEVIMPRGVHSDYAALLLEGSVEVHLADPKPPPEQKTGGCWDRPGAWVREVTDAVLDRTDRFAKHSGDHIDRVRRHDPLSWVARLRQFLAGKLRTRIHDVEAEQRLARPYATGHAPPADRKPDRIITAEANLLDRFMGLTSVVWNLPRSATLVSERGSNPEQGCVLLLMKRRVLTDVILKFCPTLYRRKVSEFLTYQLPELLTRNRLFRNTLSVQDVADGDWERFLSLLQGNEGPLRPFVRRLRELAPPFARWLGKRSAADFRDGAGRTTRYKLIKELNTLLQHSDLYGRDRWLRNILEPQKQEKVDGGAEVKLTENEVIWLNRPAFEEDFPELFGKADRPADASLSKQDVLSFVGALLACLEAGQEVFSPEEYELPKGKASCPVDNFKEGKDSTHLYLILSGHFLVSRTTSSGVKVVLNNLQQDGYFGESCVREGAKRLADIEAVASGQVLKFPREVLHDLFPAHPAVRAKFEREYGRMIERDTQRAAGERPPPQDVPQGVATRLLRATNLLLIDRDLCTRCDQCVRACAERHDGVPRFHRSNPNWRFGKWEVAAACVHCVDAPCQRACPYGTITLLESGPEARTVHIHRDRCTGCRACVPACPFDVIDMYPPTAPEEAVSLLPKNEAVATKCDLCLTPGTDPPCVASCPYDAAQRGAPADLFRGLKGQATFGVDEE